MINITIFYKKYNIINNNEFIELNNNDNIFVDPDWSNDVMFKDLELDYNIISHRYNYNLYNDTPKLEDIKQGRIGDCYLLTAFALLIKQSDIIKELIIEGKNGLYGIKIFNKGIRKLIFIDNTIPSFKTTIDIRPLFAHNKNNVSWIMLLEKAWAKFMKSYQNISIGNVSDVLNIFTGSFYFNLEIKNINNSQLWDLINFYYTKNSFIYVYDINKFINKYLIDKHSYGIIDIKIINNIKFIKLHNPWGFHIDECSIVNENGLINNKFTGEFWIEYNEFYQLFKIISINQIPNKDMYTININDIVDNNSNFGFLIEFDTISNKLYINYSTYSYNIISLDIYNYDLSNLICKNVLQTMVGSVSILSEHEKYILKPHTNIEHNIEFWIDIYSYKNIKNIRKIDLSNY